MHLLTHFSRILSRYTLYLNNLRHDLSRYCLFIEIIEPPNDATVFVNQFAEFLCEVDGGLADWSLNGIFFGSLSSEIHDDLATYRSVSENGYTLLRLVIRAKAKHNGTLVQCVTGDFNGITDKSINVTLEIQGISDSLHYSISYQVQVSLGNYNVIVSFLVYILH